MEGPARAIALVPDLMAAVRIVEMARAVGLEVETVEAGDWGRALAVPSAPALAVVDLTAAPALDAVTQGVDAGVPVLAYGPHVDAERLEAATRAGARLVVPRGRMLATGGELMLTVLQSHP